MQIIKIFWEKFLKIIDGILGFIVSGGYVLIFLGLAYYTRLDGQADNAKISDSASNPYESSINNNTSDYLYQKSGYDIGYEWAEENDINNFNDCQSEFGTSDEEDGCNEYVKENHTGYRTFGGYECTEDCSGHEAGYEWAEEHNISDSYDCENIDSPSFSEGCQAYVDENY